jgi:hypothetical protein
MKKVKFLSSSAGSYGVANTGDELVLNPSLAKELEEKGIVKVTGDAGKDAEENVVKGSLRIHDETLKGDALRKATAEEKEDPNDPTNEAKNRVREKNSKAGPNGKKK